MAGYETIISGTSPSITAVTQLDGTPIFSATTGGITFGVPVSGAGGYATGVRQVVTSFTQAVLTGTTILPADNTIPQNTEGTQFITATITPQSATSTLVILVTIGAFTPNATSTITTALFRDATVNALAASAYAPTSATATGISSLNAVVASGSTASTTFRIRAGLNVAGTLFFNGYPGPSQYFGGVCQSGITIIEVGA